jgi:hypothetical protein
MNLSPLPIQKFFDNNGAPLVGGQLFTYIAGTTTKIATYKDSSGGPTNTNPIVLDFRGEANVWLDQTLTYKFVLAPVGDTDPPTRPIWTVDNISAAVTYASLSQQILGQILYPRTGAEIAAGITPTNYFYPPGEVDRYGTNTTPGTTDMTAAFNSAFLLAKTSGLDVTYGRTWPYLLTGPVNATCAAGTSNYGYAVRNIGQKSAATTTAPFYPSILAEHTGHVFDCAGAPSIHWYDVTVGEKAGSVLKSTCWFLARNVSGGNSQYHRWTDCRTQMQASAAVIYDYGSEESQLDACLFVNTAASGSGKLVWYTANNILGLASTFITIATGTQSCIAHKVIGGSFYNMNTSATSDVFAFDNCRNFYGYGIFTVSLGRSVVFIDPTNGSSDRIILHGLETENSSPLPTYGICMAAAGGAVTHSQIVLRDSYIACGTRAVFAGNNITVGSSSFTNISELASKGLECVTRLMQSVVDQVSLIILGISQQNSLTGDTTGFTITTRTNDNWYETGTTNTTWTPGTGAVTHGGALTVSNKRLSLDGKKMFFSFAIQDSVSMSWAALTQITGLPFSASVVSADVTVTNYNTGATVGTGFVENNGIKLPALTAVGAGVIILISGSAYVS